MNMRITGKVSALSLAALVFIIAAAGCGANGGESTTAQTTAVETTAVHREGHAGNFTMDAGVGETFVFGEYEQDNNVVNGGEPVEWRVLAITNGRALLLSEKILDALPYCEDDEILKWRDCSLRFYMAYAFESQLFNEIESIRVMTIINKNGIDPGDKTSEGNDTYDNVFLLSPDEVSNTAYGFDSYLAKQDDARRARGTPFAVSRGLVVDSDGCGAWWLRSPGGPRDKTFTVRPDGCVTAAYGLEVVNNKTIGVRPAIWIDL